MWSYLHDQRSKQTSFVDLQFLSNYSLFSEKLAQKETLLKRNLEHESILYISTELSVDWKSKTFQNQAVFFARKIKCFI